MTEELGPEARALLDAARAGLSPDPAAVRRMHAKINAATAGTVAAGSLAGKLGLFALAAALAVGAGVGLRTDAPVAMAPRIELPSPSEAPERAAQREPTVPGPSDDGLIELDPPSAAPRSIAPSASPRAATPAPPEHADARATEAAPRTADLAREVELVDLAMAALRRGDAGAALEAVRLHRTETSDHGQLAEDAAAIEIESLCQLHDPSTASRLEAFDQRFPRSAQRSRLTNRCP